MAIAKKVEIGKNPQIGKYVLLGVQPPHTPCKKLVIGDNAVIRSHSVLYAGSKIGHNFRTAHGAVIRENNIIGDNVSIGTHTIIEKGCDIGNDTKIHSNCFIPEFAKIERKVWVGPSVTILNVLHPPCPKFEECAYAVVKENAKIGGSTTIGPRVTIGENAVIGFGAVVTKDVPHNSVAVGTPAKVIKSVDKLKCVLGYYKVPYEWER